MGAWWYNDKKRGRCCFLIGRHAEGMDRSETEGTSFVYDRSSVLDRTPPAADRSKRGGRENIDRRRIDSSRRRRRPEQFPPREKRARPGGDPLRRDVVVHSPRPDRPGNDDVRRAHYFAACRFHTARPQRRRRPVRQCSVPGAGRGVCRRFS